MKHNADGLPDLLGILGLEAKVILVQVAGPREHALRGVRTLQPQPLESARE